MTSNTRENFVAAEKLHAMAREFRGRFLNSVAVIEHDIAKLLTEYFCTSDAIKQELFFEQVACRFSLEKKKSLLVEILKSDYPRYWEENKKTLEDISKIQEFRNKLAHSILDVSDETLARPLDEGVSFVQWRKGAPITEQEFDEWCVRANMVFSTLSDIKRLLPYKEHPVKSN